MSKPMSVKARAELHCRRAAILKMEAQAWAADTVERNRAIETAIVEALERSRESGHTKDFDVAIAIEAQLSIHGLKIVWKPGFAPVESVLGEDQIAAMPVQRLV